MLCDSFSNRFGLYSPTLHVWQANVEIPCDEAPRLVASTWCGGVSMFGSGTSILGTWSIEFFGAGSSSVAVDMEL